MNVMIALVGLVILLALALMIGLVDGQARDSAWRRIATARRDNAEKRRDQEERERILLECLNQPRCAHCPIDHYLSSR